MLHTPPAAERAYEHVKEQILSTHLTGGAMISEGEVAQELGMSRTPVREAFLRLEVEGFLQLFPKRGAQVVPMSTQDIREVYEARLLIDAHAAAHICNLPQPAREGLWEILDGLVAKQHAALDRGELREYTLLDAEFHQTIMDHGGNTILAHLGQGLRDRQQRFTAAAIGRNVETARRFVEGHARLAAALRDGDLKQYTDEIHTHLNQSRSQL